MNLLKETQLNSNYQYQPTSSTINNVTDSQKNQSITETPYFKGTNNLNAPIFTEDSSVSFPTYLSSVESITIPKTVKRTIKRLPKSVLNKIDSNKTIAVEKCMDFVSNFTGTVFYENEDDQWLNLNSEYLNEKYKKGNDNTYIYTSIIDALTYTTNSTYPIIEVKKGQYGNETYKSGAYSKAYRLNQCFQTINFETYTLTCEDLIEKRRKQHLKKLSEAIENKIAYNLLRIYPTLEIPSIEKISIEADRLIEDNYHSKKGKALCKLNKRKKEKIKDFKNKTFVEENIKQYLYLTQKGYLMPYIGNYKSGGRVVDSFNLMPSWIREFVKINGEEIVEVDFKALHPNLAMQIYKGSTKYITHQNVANALGISLQEVKTEHLSFFNRRIQGMKRSPLYEYYNQHEPQLLKNIINDKRGSDFSHKITSMKMFELEVQIMTEVISRLNNQGIYVLYIYDALGCKKSEAEIVQKTMNEVILEFGVFTVAG
jgi:hypothetical protein